ncbi:DapH/DapD/GlmU-related protein [Aquimarina aquimarini]|uniref:DapH/DapD/GlmU-related protein n=1 Tax=Aquimarina aquimarini TaxID=1191734 RepID=UPI000D560617|nr:DapH/DapD/GlmU-related protein [Aquimarina aquimarini]
MINIKHFLQNFYFPLIQDKTKQPWDVITDLENIIINRISMLNTDYKIENNIAIHKTALIEKNVTIKAPAIIEKNCFIGANAYLRNGIYLAENVKIGASCEIKSSCIFNNSAIAHFNFIGDSVIGQKVNFEAGSITANHYNERKEKRIFVTYNGIIIDTKTEKFGSLVGDNSKIGANAVLSPGTILEANSIVKRLELIEQVK